MTLLQVAVAGFMLWPLVCLWVAEWRLERDGFVSAADIWPWLCSLVVVRIGLVSYWLALMTISSWWMLCLSLAAWDGWRLVKTLRSWGSMRRLRAEQCALRDCVERNPDLWISQRQRELLSVPL